MPTYVVRLWLPDRPGALGLVASRVGAVRGDVVGIDILERGGGRAVDELVVELPDDDLVELLVAEMTQVDGVAVEDVRVVDRDRPDPGSAALELAATLVEAPACGRLEQVVRELTRILDADWAVALDATTSEVLHTELAPNSPSLPTTGWLGAFLDGSRHLDRRAQAAGAPGDLAWGWLGPLDALPGSDVVIALARARRPFHLRERRQVEALCRVTAALLGAGAGG